MRYPETAKRLKLAMDLKGMKAVELSNRTGVLRSSISQYLSGMHSMKNSTAGLIAECLGVSPVWLMGFDVPMLPEPDGKDSAQQTYYTKEETEKLAYSMATNPELRALYDIQRDMDAEDLNALYGMALALKRKSERLDSDDPA